MKGKRKGKGQSKGWERRPRGLFVHGHAAAVEHQGALLDRPDPLGLPAWLAFLSPVVCLLVFAVGVKIWWLGVRHYQSTGS
ncbi:MAG TPA: hypothetical protein VJ793_00350 [Anaerolineae bacterium]|nr:hypothetical protein [Anaerolineae bacterium]